MNPALSRKVIPALLLACGLAVASGGARAEMADLADVPLANSPTDAVLPNLMFILDDSGSMAWNYMPDNVLNTSSGAQIPNCKNATGGLVQCSLQGASWGEPPYFAAQFNQIYYNPDITYAPAVDSSGLSVGNASPTAAKRDAYLDPTADNLTTSYPDIYYCSTTSPSSTQLTDPAVCRRNGINNLGAVGYFLYWSPNTTNGGYPITGFNNRVVRNNSAAYYFTISPHEYCSDPNLINCQLANADGSAPAGFPIPAPVRYCQTAAQAASTAAQSDAATSTTPKCRKKWTNSGTPRWPVPRYGRFTRVDITAATATYPKRPTAVRTDCAGATSCTYAEELQNFANWYSYYRTRMAMMKTATGRAFTPIDDRYRVGFITINPGNPVRDKNVVASDARYLPLRTFDATQRGDFYSILYAQQDHGSTPLRTALARVGRHYAAITSGINSGMSTDPVTHSCQQHFALLTTDGYWNDADTGAIDTAGAQVGDQDGTPSAGTPVYVSRPTGTLDGLRRLNTLADVAMYYYKTDLRTGTPTSISDNSTVKTTAKDVAKHQHMVTFTLGLGLQGMMDYVSDYESNSSSDFAKIKNGDVGTCSWLPNATCNWPAPAANTPSTLDDLWHAAVNGRGVYYSASDPNSLADGLSGALAALKMQDASASASATSSPNVTETDNFIYSSTFRTVKWDGQVEAQRIDPTNGTLVPGFVWRAQGLLDAKVSAASDSRRIWKFDSSAANNIEPFLWANLSAGAGTACAIASEQACFANKCTALSQCPLLTAPQQTLANDGQNMVNWLRGQSQHEASIYRDREHVLGDPANAQPAFVKAPRFAFNDSVTPTYGQFQTANASRQGVLFIAANDGMLHALNADTGEEMWAYAPRIVFPQLHELATDNWDVRHKYTVDGSPQIMDAYHASASAWKTLLVAGLNKGGRGYYALDVTDPFNPKGLWEFCSDSTLCERSDPDLGYSYGTPIITKRAFDGRWVVLVTSGVNNVSAGSGCVMVGFTLVCGSPVGTGYGYLYVLDAFTGTVLQKVEARDGATTFGDTTTPSGFAKISAFANNPQVDNTALYVYGGDLFGNVWRFDMRVDPPAVLKIGELKDASGRPQSITTKPELSVVQGKRVIFIGTGRYLGEDDLVDGATLTPPLQWSYQNTIYAIKDKDAKYDNGAGSSNIRTSSPGLVAQVMTDSSGVRTITSNVVDWATKDGWYIDLNPGNTSPGERVNLDPQLVLGTLIVVGNVPNNNACTVGGDSFIYQIDFDSGTAIASSPNGIIGEKRTGEITVGVVAICLSGGQCKGIGTGAGGEKDTFGLNLGGASGSGRRISWRELVQ